MTYIALLLPPQELSNNYTIMAPKTLTDNHPVVLSLRTAALLTSAAGFISLAWSITHHEGISDDGAGSINSVVLGTVAYAFLWSLVALTIRLIPRRIHPGIYLAFDMIAFLANAITGSIGLAVLAPVMEGGYSCYSTGCDGDAVLRVEIFAYVVVFVNVVVHLMLVVWASWACHTERRGKRTGKNGLEEIEL
ncbi:hypothetical protein IFM60648_06957 [Aspergillus lentulus]|uniref:MARVEL domain-containing protein n=2 Tax=Aspergillus lentulus TaxID=293939 RepID=A0ABQ1APV0_ASPLE|nr:hypothetical protein IFM62136_08809 [Aspergillus lentulus]GFF84224.1 hypothetical protein IFM60648_06957 [Aspergillus lentulus]